MESNPCTRLLSLYHFKRPDIYPEKILDMNWVNWFRGSVWSLDVRIFCFLIKKIVWSKSAKNIHAVICKLVLKTRICCHPAFHPHISGSYYPYKPAELDSTALHTYRKFLWQLAPSTSLPCFPISLSTHLPCHLLMPPVIHYPPPCTTPGLAGDREDDH